MIYAKKNFNKDTEILAICDENLIGKHFEEGILKLDITERFYKGELVDDKKAIILMEKARNINIIGKDSIALALKSNIIQKENIVKVKNIPHTIIFEL